MSPKQPVGYRSRTLKCFKELQNSESVKMVLRKLTVFKRNNIPTVSKVQKQRCSGNRKTN